MTVSQRVPAVPPAFGRIVTRHVEDETLAMLTAQAASPGWLTIRRGVDESGSVEIAVTVSDAPRVDVGVLVVIRKAPAKTLIVRDAAKIPHAASASAGSLGASFTCWSSPPQDERTTSHP